MTCNYRVNFIILVFPGRMDNLAKLIRGGGIDWCNIKLFTSTDWRHTQYSKFYENLKEVSFPFIYIYIYIYIYI